MEEGSGGGELSGGRAAGLDARFVAFLSDHRRFFRFAFPFLVLFLLHCFTFTYFRYLSFSLSLSLLFLTYLHYCSCSHSIRTSHRIFLSFPFLIIFKRHTLNKRDQSSPDRDRQDPLPSQSSRGVHVLAEPAVERRRCSEGQNRR